jgi:hypothetical protein
MKLVMESAGLDDFWPTNDDGRTETPLRGYDADRLGNKRLRRGDEFTLELVTLNHWIVGSIPTRCMAEYQGVKNVFT